MQNLKLYCSTQQTIKPNQTYNMESKRQNFDFLIQSIDRQKFAHSYLSNNNPDKDKERDRERDNERDKENEHLNFNDGRLSAKVKPSISMLDRGRNCMTRSTYFGVTQKLTSSIEKDKEKDKGREREKEREKDKAEYDRMLESLLYKIKRYLAITEPMIHANKTGYNEQKSKKQAIKTACEIIQILSTMQNYQLQNLTQTIAQTNQANTLPGIGSASLNSTSNLILGCNKSMSSSFHFPQQPQSPENSLNFLKKIENLEEQKMQLENIISQHQRANIKMFIQLNEGESQEIETYKKQLSSLFEKYKKLEKLVRKEADKSKNLQILVDDYQQQIRVLTAALKSDRERDAKDNRDIRERDRERDNRERDNRERDNREQRDREREKEREKNEQRELKEYLRRIAQFESLINEQNDSLAKALQQIEHWKSQASRSQKQIIVKPHQVPGIPAQKRSQWCSQSQINELGSESLFNKIILKPTRSVGSQEQCLYRMMLAQASIIDEMLIKN